MANFSIGTTSAGSLPKARGLPEGTPVRLANLEVIKSNFKRTIQTGAKKGQEAEQYQLRVVYETLAPGSSLAYTTAAVAGRAGTSVAAVPFDAGAQFIQYFGGVYIRDNGDVKLSEAGGAAGFINALKDAGAPIGDKLEAFIGLAVTIQHLKGRAPSGPYVHALPGKLIADTVARSAPSAPAPAPAAPPPLGPGMTPFQLLGVKDQEAIVEAQKGGPVTDQDLVDAGIAKDVAHAAAILGSVPTARANLLLTRKAA